jgi:hypothetical protein
MIHIRAGIIQDTIPNHYGDACTDCSEPAYRVMIVLIRGVRREVPLCAAHYMEACDMQPVMGYKVSGGRKRHATSKLTLLKKDLPCAS